MTIKILFLSVFCTTFFALAPAVHAAPSRAPFHANQIAVSVAIVAVDADDSSDDGKKTKPKPKPGPRDDGDGD